MLKISKLTDYGAVLMTHLANQPNALLTAKDIANATYLSLPTVSKLLKLLAGKKLLVSHRGAKGGYALARDAANISLAQIVAALDGDIALTECAGPTDGCEREAICNTRGHWQFISTAIHAALDEISLADMIHSSPSTVIDITRIKSHFKAGEHHG